MITLKRFNNKEFILNCDLIETIETTPDTVIKLNNGKQYVVVESKEEVLEKIINYKKNIFSGVING